MALPGGNDLTLKVGFDIDKFQKELQKTSGILNKWGTSVTSALQGVAAGFSAIAVGQFVLDVSKLAGEAEGVRAAFDKLPNSVRVMEELKEATSGTVSELDLMKRTVMATNFGIGIESLPRLLEFAAIRAKQTGQSVDYLVDSIVTGIGRKSPLILDNLGISTTRLKEKFGGAALEAQSIADVAKAVGAIAEEELSKMGSMSENASTKVERLGASWVNLKVALGDMINNSNTLTGAIDSLTTSVDLLASKNIGLLQKLMAIVNPAMAVSAIAEDVAKSAMAASAAQQKQNEITETASVLLKDLGLDYEALMNVAGDNVNVMEIWAEMQRMVAERTANATKEINNQATAIQKLSGSKTIQFDLKVPELQKFTELGNILDGLVPKFQNIKIPIKDTQTILNELGKSFADIGVVAIEVGEIIQIALNAGFVAIGEEIGNAIAGVGNFGDSILKAFAGLASQIGSILIALGTAALVAQTQLLTNPAAAIAAGVALVAIGKIASASISKAAANMGGSGGGGASVGMARSADTFRPMASGAQTQGYDVRIKGQDLYIALNNYNKYNKSTAIGG